MTRPLGKLAKVSMSLALAVPMLAVSSPSNAVTVPPFDGTPVSHGLGPTYGETWCAQAAPGSSIANQQGSPLALIPQEAVGCTLAQFQAEATAAGIPHRMDYSVIGTSVLGRNLYGVVVNDLETANQQRDYQRYLNIRAIELTDPVGAQALLDSYGSDVKIPIFIQANIHGDEEEGTDAMMQAIRDIVTTPRGTNATVDEILDHAVLIVNPIENPDGRFIGQRANGNNIDMNRDWLVQSQAEVRTSAKLQQQWLATVGLDMHGYQNPTLIDGLTKPHNPGIEYDLFLYWNQRRLDANESAESAVGVPIQRPVNEWNQQGVPPGSPILAEGWDDWGPFYTQTYMAFYGVDSSTVEMCSTGGAGGVGCDGRLGSKLAQYIAFYSSADYWINNRHDMMHDQLEIFRRGVTDAARPHCCDDPLIMQRLFREEEHNWMVEYPKAYVIPQNGGAQRSNGEANRMVQWLLDNGVQVTKATANFTWGTKTFPAGSYVVWMNQALRGIALTALSAGQDVSVRIGQLYAPPAAWSHGLLWGADVMEIPRGDPTFTPSTTPITVTNPLQGGVRDGVGAPSDFYSVTLRGVSEVRAILGLLRDGVYGEMAQAPFVSTTGGPMPAGTLIFPNDPATAAAIDAAGQAAGITFERNTGVTKPPTTLLNRAPKVAILVNSANPATSDTSLSLKQIFGSDATFLSVLTGSNSIQNAPTDPLLNYDVIYNAGQAYPAATNNIARSRLNAFFARGGGYLATSQSTNNFSFLTGAAPPLVMGSFTQGSQTAYGGIAVWANSGGAASPLTGGFPAQDYLYLPQNTTYFTATPTGSTVDGRYLSNMASSPSPGYVAGLWNNRDAAANNAPVIVHGTTTANSCYMGLATNPFSRVDAEREWMLIGQAALMCNLTDETKLGQAITFDPIPDKTYGDPDFTVSPTASSGLTVFLSASGQCTLSSTTSPATVHLTAAGSCTITASQPGNANFNPAPSVSRTFSITLACPGYSGDPRTQIVGTAGADTLVGSSGDDILCGLGGNDTLRGLEGNDLLLGGDNKDTLLGGAGNDTFDGGTGVDTTSFADGPVASGVTANLATGTATNAQLGSDTFVPVSPGGCSTVENLTGSGYNDSLTGDACNNTLYGANGGDSLTGGGGADLLQGVAGNDSLSGGDGSDLLEPGTGDDPSNNGGNGFDTLAYVDVTTGGVNINLVGGTATGTATGGAGSDVFTPSTLEAYYGSNSADTLTGDTGSNLLYGLGGADAISGGGGNDTMGGGAGADSIDGGGGVDSSTYYTAPSGATVDLSAGTASADGTGSADSLISVENVLGSNAGGDSITGSAGSNALYGLGGNDSLSGLGGNDYLDGGAGTDTLNGGDGTDRCLNGEGTLTSCESTTSPLSGSSGLSVAVIISAEARMARLLGAQVGSTSVAAGPVPVAGRL
jgi:Ca2+-binding RTX toxin-like protein